MRYCKRYNESTTETYEVNTMNHCCDKFKKEAGEVQAMAGGCYVVTEVKFCPFCGANVERHS